MEEEQGQTLLKPIFGIAPERISAMVNRDVVEQHVEEASFLWLQHQSAVSRPDYLLEDIAELNGYLDANLEGIFLAGEVGWQLCESLLDEGEEYIFPATVTALWANNPEWIKRVFKAVDSENADAFIGALGWLDYPAVKPFIHRLLTETRPFYQYLGIAACGLHRQFPTVDMSHLLPINVPLLKSRILRLTGELKGHAFGHLLFPYLSSENDAYRFWSAWSLALMGERQQSLPVLQSFMYEHSEYQRTAMNLLLRVLDKPQQKQIINELIARDALPAAVFAVGVTGLPEYMSWLIEMMKEPALARLAGEAFSMITGVDLDYDDLTLEEPDEKENDDEEDEAESQTDVSQSNADFMDDNSDDDDWGEEDEDKEEEEPDEYEQDLDIPDPALVADWWQQYQLHYTNGTRYLAGKVINEGNLYEVLNGGFQRQRSAAALELALLAPENPFLETRTKANAQINLDIATGGKHG